MSQLIFVNLPVADLAKSVEFFTALGYTFDPKFTSETGTMMNISDQIKVMLLKHEFFKTFIPNKNIADSFKTCEVLVALSANSREEVDTLIDKAIAAGGSEHREPDHNNEFMYGRAFQDLDGHIWEIMWMDAQAVQQ